MSQGRVAVVSHDAGGAEILSSWLLRYTESYILVLDGPAVNIFKRKFGNCSIVPLEEAIEQCDWILCGTSWQSSLERNAFALAKSVGKRSVAFLDHWVNYKERFLDRGTEVLPDEIWVGDDEALKIANSQFKDIPIVVHANPYFEDLRQELVRIPQIAGKLRFFSVLYVSEPVREYALFRYGDEHFYGYTEEEALIYFLGNIASLLGYSDPVIRLRLHPSENKGKYDGITGSSALHIEVCGKKTLLEEVSEADVVVGCSSMALVVGLLANKRVISSIPPGGKSCSLPYVEIEHMRNLMRDYQSDEHA